MATSKTLTPTNVTISIPEMTDSPDASVFSNCVDKEADAINSLNNKIGKQDSAYFWGTVVKISGGQAILFPIDNIYLNSLTVNVSKITNITIPGVTNLSPTSISKYRNCLYVVVSNDLTNYIGYVISMAYTLDS